MDKAKLFTEMKRYLNVPPYDSINNDIYGDGIFFNNLVKEYGWNAVYDTWKFLRELYHMDYEKRIKDYSPKESITKSYESIKSICWECRNNCDKCKIREIREQLEVLTENYQVVFEENRR